MRIEPSERPEHPEHQGDRHRDERGGHGVAQTGEHEAEGRAGEDALPQAPFELALVVESLHPQQERDGDHHKGHRGPDRDSPPAAWPEIVAEDELVHRAILWRRSTALMPKAS